MEVCNRLKIIRMQMYMENQKEFSKRLGLLHSTYNQLELGKRLPSIEVALNTANLLGMKVEDIWYLD